VKLTKITAPQQLKINLKRTKMKRMKKRKKAMKNQRKMLKKT